MALAFVLGFVVGAMTIVAVEALGLLFLLRLLNRKEKAQAVKSEERTSRLGIDLDSRQSLESFSNKKGVVWVLEPDKIPRDQKWKKEILDVFPVRKCARIKDRSLILTESDGSAKAISLKGCIVTAVSATSLPSRKWAKKYPIKVENRTSVIYNNCRTFYIYLDTSWEKESWCKALRFASFDDKEKIDWFVKLNAEFHSYLTSLNAGYPFFSKPFLGSSAEPVERTNKVDSSKKVYQLWKKLMAKVSKAGLENKSTWNSLLGNEERKMSEKSFVSPDAVSVCTTSKIVPLEESMVMPSSVAIPHSATQSNVSDTEADEKRGIDEGTLCLNLIMSRLFFDAKRNMKMTVFLQAWIKRALSNMRIPTYMGDVICTDINIGNLPPHIHSIRVLPMDMNEVWAVEIDIEYSGGLKLDIETRLEVRDLNLAENIEDRSSESSSVREATDDLLEGVEHYGKQLKLSEGSANALEQREGVDTIQDGMQNSKSPMDTETYAFHWKTILNSVAKQVSQVPLSLGIKVASLRGTVRLHIKPPPSDQLWFGFISMPDIDLNLESSLGDRKINSGHIALFLTNRFKAGIRDTVVLPNCENIFIPGMLGETDDWVPRSVAPFIWVNHEGNSNPATSSEVPRDPSGVVNTKTEAGRAASSNEPELKCEKSESGHGEQSEVGPQWQSREIQECQQPLGSDNLSREAKAFVDQDDARPKKMSRRARMFEIGKKMGERLEEKKLHLEEKSRLIVEKMERNLKQQRA